jgi:hypothetical protein
MAIPRKPISDYIRKESEVIGRARQLLSTLDVLTPPVDIERLAEVQGVKEVIREAPENGADAELTPITGGYLIRVDPNVNLSRQRFSIAHEIAHTFFGHNHKSYRGQAVLLPSGVSRGLGYQWEEDLCDRAAAELLMPKTLFQPEATREELSLNLLRRLASTFQASLTATLSRYAKLVDTPFQLTAWRKRSEFLRGRVLAGPRIIEGTSIRPNEAEPGVETSIVEAFESNAHVKRWELEGYRRIFVDAMGFLSGDDRFVISIFKSAITTNQ